MLKVAFFQEILHPQGGRRQNPRTSPDSSGSIQTNPRIVPDDQDEYAEIRGFKKHLFCGFGFRKKGSGAIRGFVRIRPDQSGRIRGSFCATTSIYILVFPRNRFTPEICIPGNPGKCVILKILGGHGLWSVDFGAIHRTEYCLKC